MKFAILLFFIFLFLTIFPLIFLKSQSSQELPPPTHHPDIVAFFESLINFLFTLTLVCLPGVIVIAGILFITSGGEPEKNPESQKPYCLIVYSFVGFVVLS